MAYSSGYNRRRQGIIMGGGIGGSPLRSEDLPPVASASRPLPRRTGAGGVGGRILGTRPMRPKPVPTPTPATIPGRKTITPRLPSRGYPMPNGAGSEAYRRY